MFSSEMAFHGGRGLSLTGGSSFTKMDRIVLLFFPCFALIFCLGLPETGSHTIAQAKLDVTVTSWQFACLSLTSTGVTGKWGATIPIFSFLAEILFCQ